jgi:hypothetical protein
MTAYLRWALAFALLMPWAAHAVDGIAISTQYAYKDWDRGGDLVRYDIKNGDVVKRTIIFDGAGGNVQKARSRARFPSINKQGTQVAFFRATNDSAWFVCVMNLDGTGLCNLARIPSTYSPRGYLYLTTDGWVYYTMGGDQTNDEGSHLLWRVNVNDPSTNQQVVRFDYGLWQFGMSADGKRMVLRPAVDVNDGSCCASAYRYIPPGDGHFTAANRLLDGMGCGLGISPSGTWVMKLQGGSHTGVGLSTWEHSFTSTSNTDVGFHSFLINKWLLPSGRVTAHCGYYEVDTTITLYAGLGMDCNRWSSNSDKWLCLQMGWPEQSSGSGRYSYCGSNQVLFNWVDSIAIGTSQLRRSCMDSYGFGANCDVDLPDSMFRRSDAGDFFVTAPQADVNADLRALVSHSGIPSSAVPGPGALSIRPSAEGMLVRIAVRGSFQVRILDVKGRLVARRAIEGPTAAWLAVPDAALGVRYITLANGANSWTVTTASVSQ